MLVARLSAPGWDQVAASAQLRCSWLCPPPAPHRTPEAEAGRGRGPASRGGGGEEEWEGEGAALTRRLPENTLRVASSHAGIFPGQPLQSLDTKVASCLPSLYRRGN